MKKNLTLILVFFLTSCSSNVTISPRGCYAKKSLWKSDKAVKGKPFLISKKISSRTSFDGDGRTIYLKKILEDNKVNCKNIESLKYQFSHSTWDLFTNLIPFYSQMTIKISGSTYDQ